MAPSVSILGLGLMGRPIARRLKEAGYQLSGWNRSPLPGELVEGLSVIRTLREAAQAEVCLLVLADSDAVEEVLTRLEPHLAGGRLVIDMGTSDPVRSRIHAQRLAGRDISWVDAPVSGGPEGAAGGTLTIMAGGEERGVTRARPILQALGSKVVHVGDPGAGHMMKLVNQVIVGLTIEAVAEALMLAERSGLDLRLVQDALRDGFADSKILQIHGTRMIERSYLPGGKVTTQLKDLRMAWARASSLGLDLPHLYSALQMYEQLAAQGDGGLDHSALHKLLQSPAPRA